MTQTLWQKKPKRMRITVDGKTAPGIAAKDIALTIIAKIRADGAQGHAIEFAGSAITALVDGRPPDPLQHVDRGRRPLWHGGARRYNIRLSSKTGLMRRKPRRLSEPLMIGPRSSPIDDAVFDREVTLDAGSIAPIVTWGTTPDDALPIDATRARSGARNGRHARAKYLREALDYMGLKPGNKTNRYYDRPRVHRLLYQRTD